MVVGRGSRVVGEGEFTGRQEGSLKDICSRGQRFLPTRRGGEGPHPRPRHRRPSRGVIEKAGAAARAASVEGHTLALHKGNISNVTPRDRLKVSGLMQGLSLAAETFLTS